MKYYLYKLNTSKLNIVSMFLLVILFYITYLLMKENILSLFNNSIYITFLLMIPYLILHELLHCISYVIHKANFKNITFGIHLEKGILCCLCKQNISKKNILISLLYPFIFMGVITYIIGIIFSNNILILLSIINISGCSGDLIMFFDLLKIKNFEYSEYDDPISFGLYSSDNLGNLKLFGLDYIKESTKLERKDLKKITISKSSIVFLIMFLILIILNILLIK